MPVLDSGRPGDLFDSGTNGFRILFEALRTHFSLRPPVFSCMQYDGSLAAIFRMTLTLPRIYPILDTATLNRLGFDPVAASVAFLEGGARILQFRHKAFWSRQVFAQAEEIAALCHDASAPFILNDRADYALLLHA